MPQKWIPGELPKAVTPGVFLLNSDITIDIKELLQPFTTMHPNGLSSLHHQAQILYGAYPTSTQDVHQYYESDDLSP